MELQVVLTEMKKNSGYVGVWSKIINAITKMDVDTLVPLHTLEKRLGGRNSIGFCNQIWVGQKPLKYHFNILYCLDVNLDCHIIKR